MKNQFFIALKKVGLDSERKTVKKCPACELLSTNHLRMGFVKSDEECSE